MKHIRSLIAGALVATALLSGQASAAVIGAYSFDYRTGSADTRSGQGFSQNADGVRITSTGGTFRDTFDFSNLAGAVIDSFDLTFTFAGAGPSNLINIFGIGLVRQEQWRVYAEGSNAASRNDDLSALLIDNQSPWTGSISAASDGSGTDVFATALANLSLGVSFVHEGFSTNRNFTLSGIQLTVNGTAATSAVVPLPAPGLLLLAALGGLGLMRRRARSRPVA